MAIYDERDVAARREPISRPGYSAAGPVAWVIGLLLLLLLGFFVFGGWDGTRTPTTGTTSTSAPVTVPERSSGAPITAPATTPSAPVNSKQ